MSRSITKAAALWAKHTNSRIVAMIDRKSFRFPKKKVKEKKPINYNHNLRIAMNTYT